VRHLPPPTLTPYQYGSGRWRTISRNRVELLVNVRVPEIPGKVTLCGPLLWGMTIVPIVESLVSIPIPGFVLGAVGARWTT
jgi:hypothetical protein